MPERGSKLSTVPVVWATFGIFSARFIWFPVEIGDQGPNLVISLWLGDKATLNGVATWRLNSPRPQKFRVQKSAEKVLASIFWNQDGFLLIDYLPKSQIINAEYYSSLLVQLKDILKEKRRDNLTKGYLVVARKYPGSPDTCNAEETGLPELPVSWSPTLFDGAGPVGLSPVPWTEKTNESSPFFVRRGGHCYCRDLVGRTTFWIFFWEAYKS